MKCQIRCVSGTNSSRLFCTKSHNIFILFPSVIVWLHIFCISKIVNFVRFLLLACPLFSRIFCPTHCYLMLNSSLVSSLGPCLQWGMFLGAPYAFLLSIQRSFLYIGWIFSKEADPKLILMEQVFLFLHSKTFLFYFHI